MEIDGVEIDDDRVYVIAEAGVNHNGDLEKAKNLVEVAANSGADAVKFQTFSAERLVTNSSEKLPYQKEHTSKNDSPYEMLSTLELTYEDHQKIQEWCKDNQISFLSTPFDKRSLEKLVHLDIPAIKVASGELTNKPLLQSIASHGRPMIVSTGMATMQEVHDAVGWIQKKTPTIDLALLHCTSSYPTPPKDVNLRMIETLDSEFNLPVGYSDHTTAVETPALAVAAGATIVEKHFTLDRSMQGPDHEASLEPRQLDQMVSLVREAAVMRGSPMKEPTDTERMARAQSRKSLYTTRRIEAGTVLDRDDVTVKRPAVGLPPSSIEQVIGREITKTLEPESVIREAVLSDGPDNK